MNKLTLYATIVFLLLIGFAHFFVQHKSPLRTTQENSINSVNIQIAMDSTGWDKLLEYLRPMYEDACLQIYVNTYSNTVPKNKIICKVDQNRVYLLTEKGKVLGTRLVILPQVGFSNY